MPETNGVDDQKYRLCSEDALKIRMWQRTRGDTKATVHAPGLPLDMLEMRKDGGLGTSSEYHMTVT